MCYGGKISTPDWELTTDPRYFMYLANGGTATQSAISYLPFQMSWTKHPYGTKFSYSYVQPRSVTEKSFHAYIYRYKLSTLYRIV